MLKLNLQYFGGNGKTLYELKQNLSTVGQQLQKTEEELASAAIDTSKTTEDIQSLQSTKKDLKMRFDVLKEQHDALEAEQKAKFNQQEPSFEGLSDDQKMVKAKAEFIRASIEGRPVSDDVKQIYALPGGNPSGGDKFLPTNLQNELVHEPFARNQLREVAATSNIKGLELPKISYTINDDAFIDDTQVAKELAATGDVVTFARNKFKVKAKISDTIVHGSDIELVNYVDNALRSGLAAKEKKDALAGTPVVGLEYMSFYGGGVTSVTTSEANGGTLYKSIKAAIADLHEDFRDNAHIVMRYADYMDIIETLANGNATLYQAQPEQVLGKPVHFADGATKPIVGDFNYFRINYDAMTYDTDKDVDSGDYLFVLTAWYDQKRSLNSAFRIAEVVA
ncbi:phage major capsid protein [Terrihalobacillus insolitus]|uniref:phage major capsid protein n=1 Tax=Terrihalobacillus insolitus TaxID=2950438 RepID=UPI0023417403|nr:phage major capsid protein [Terrihalobacillus insolitus]MDC3412533.1 phage major capsid protein [Terrihalobacillus insolitus]